MSATVSWWTIHQLSLALSTFAQFITIQGGATKFCMQKFFTGLAGLVSGEGGNRSGKEQVCEAGPLPTSFHSQFFEKRYPPPFAARRDTCEIFSPLPLINQTFLWISLVWCLIVGSLPLSSFNFCIPLPFMKLWKRHPCRPHTSVAFNIWVPHLPGGLAYLASSLNF